MDSSERLLQGRRRNTCRDPGGGQILTATVTKVNLKSTIVTTLAVMNEDTCLLKYLLAESKEAIVFLVIRHGGIFCLKRGITATLL